MKNPEFPFISLLKTYNGSKTHNCFSCHEEKEAVILITFGTNEEQICEECVLLMKEAFIQPF